MTLVLIDARNAMFRYGSRHIRLKASNGESTGALYGILSSLVQFKRRYKDARFVMVWDGGRGWRQEFFPAYKGNRGEGEPKPEIKQILEQERQVRFAGAFLCIPQVCIQNVEADDVIAVLARKFVGKHRVMISSSDKDFMQLVQYRVEIVQHGTTPITEAMCHRRFGVSSADVLKVRVLIGDKSDNIDGAVRGVGPKTAVKMIEAGVDPLATDWVAGGQHPKLSMAWNTLVRNKQLMTLPSEVSHLHSVKIRNDMRRVIKDVAYILSKKFDASTPVNGLVKYLSALDLKEAVEFRHILCSLQK